VHDERRLAGTLAARHRALPYDVCYQFANLESFGVPSRRDDRPPLVMHPAVHAAGELRWLRAERPLAQGLEGSVQPALVRAWLTARALRQRRDARRADRVLALSAAFGRLLVEDCGVAPERVTVVPDCIDLERFAPLEDATASVATVASVGRLAVRKGLEDVVALSSSLRDLEGEVELAVVGGGSLWSDYSGLLEGLDPSVGRALGRLDREEVRQLVAASRCVLQLSRYEPFGLTVAEALACGVPVVVTPAVGAAEGLPAEVARVVEPGDVAAVDAAVRELLSLAPDERAFLAARCRHAARRFAPDVVAAALYEALVEVASPATRAAGTVE